MRLGRIHSAIAGAILLGLLLPAAAGAERSVYVSNGSSVGTFTVNKATGTLSPATATTVPGGTMQHAVALTPDGRYLYVADTGGSQVLGYTVGAGGALTPMAAPFATGGAPMGLTATADGRYVYVANSGPGTISGFAVGAGGALTPLPSSPYPGGAGIVGIASSPDASLVYVTEAGPAPNVVGLSIRADGSLTPLPSTPADAVADPRMPVFTPDGDFLYVADIGGSGSVHGFSVSASGALTPVPGSPFAADNAEGALAMAPDGGHLYASGGTGGITAFSVAPDGSLGAVPGSPFAAGSSAIQGTAVSPDGGHLYSAHSGAAPNVAGFAIGSGGAVAPVPGSPFSSGGTGAAYGSLAISPDQSPTASFTVVPAKPGIEERAAFLADASSDPDGTIAAYGWDFGDGKAKLQTDPKVHHKYRKAGTYTATLTVVDDEGCSSAPIYTGQTASCSGSRQSVATKAVRVVDDEVDRPEIVARPRQVQRGRRIVVAVEAGAKEHVEVVGTGTVKVKGRKGRSRARARGRGRGKRLALAKVRKSVRAKHDKKLKLKLKRRGADRKVFRALDAHRPVKARIFVKVTDDAGNSVKPKLVIELK